MFLITGGHGMIGTHLNYGFKPTSKEMDITDVNSINSYINNLDISCIIHLAAVNLRESEDNIKKAINVNINGTINMLQVAKDKNIPFVFVSSGAVFASDNSNMKFDKSFNKCPTCLYGFTKSAAEDICLLYEKSIIIRTGWLFGGNQKNHYKFIDLAVKNLLLNTEVKATNDFFGSYTYVKDMIIAMQKIIDNKEYGIHHVVNEGIACGYDVVLEIIELLQKDKKLVTAVNSQEVPNPGPYRGKSEILVPTCSMRHYQEALKEYIHDNFLNNLLKPIVTYQDIVKRWKNRDKCRLCDCSELYTFFNLQATPLANHFTNKNDLQEVIPLDICICLTCKHIQLKQIVDPEYQYSNYLYLSSTSRTMIKHLCKSVDEFTYNIVEDEAILEIGANDGTCIKHLMEQGFTNVIGVDPAKNIKRTHNLPVICDFFGSHINFAQKFKLIYAFHCCAHIENINDVFATVAKILDKDGVFVMEVGYFYDVFKNKLFDVIYHEHIDYHTCTAMSTFVEKFNLKLFRIAKNEIQGGSIQFFIGKNKDVETSVYQAIEEESKINLFDTNNLANWKLDVIRNGNDINYLLNSFIAYGKKIAGYGASAKLTTFMYQYNLSKHLIRYIIDDNIHKQGLLTPGLHIPIKSITELAINPIDYIVIFGWNFAEEISEKLEPYRKLGLRIIVPFPKIEIY